MTNNHTDFCIFYTEKRYEIFNFAIMSEVFH